MEPDSTPVLHSEDNEDSTNNNLAVPATRPRHDRRRDRTRDSAVQTDNDILTDESPEFAASPPLCKKKELLPSPGLLDGADDVALALKTEGRGRLTVKQLVSELTEDLSTDLLRVRAIFKWITANIR
jgi:hypothetical protein